MKTPKPELPLNNIVEAHQAQTRPLLGHAELTLRDEANVMTAWVFRDGGLQDFGPEPAPGCIARLSAAELEHLLVATSARLAQWLAVRERYVVENPATYHQFVAVAKMISADGWEREALSIEPTPAPTRCSSCHATINEMWRYCPGCGHGLQH